MWNCLICVRKLQISITVLLLCSPKKRSWSVPEYLCLAKFRSHSLLWNHFEAVHPAPSLIPPPTSPPPVVSTQSLSRVPLNDTHSCLFFLTMSTLMSEEAVWGRKGGKEHLPDRFTYCAGLTLLLSHVPFKEIMVRRTISSYPVGSYLSSSSVLRRLLQTN